MTQSGQSRSDRLFDQCTGYVDGIDDQGVNWMLSISTLIRLLAYAIVTGTVVALAATFAFPGWSQNGTGATVAVVGSISGLIYAMLTREPRA